MKHTMGKADYLLKESGCGLFQVLIVLFVDVIIKGATVCSMLFMAFGNYNPGWRCLDINTTTTLIYNVFNKSSDTVLVDVVELNSTSYSSLLSIDTTKGNNDTTEYITQGSCDLFEICQNVEFNPESSTIVTEWGLICDKSWVPSLIISIQMAGIFAGSLIAGQLGDTFGRKKTLYTAFALLCVLTISGVFSTYWQVYTVFRFFIGGMIACLYTFYNILPAEYLNSKWRIRLAAFPSWHIGGLLFGVAAMTCKDWKILHLIIGVYCIVACIPGFWVPESLRWLEVKNKTKEFQKVAWRMIRLNKIPITLESLSKIIEKEDENDEDKSESRVYTVIDLFRKGYRLHAIIIAFIWFLPAIAYFAIIFGVKSMYGDFYINLLLLFSVDLVYSIVPMCVPNIIGRKKRSILFISISAASFLAATAFGVWAMADIRHTALVVLALMAKTNILATFSCNIVLVTEIFPTVVRSNAIGYCNFVSRLGGIVAPLLIPNDSNDFHLCYAIMGIMCLICSVLLIKLPETKDRTLREVFAEETNVKYEEPKEAQII